MTILLVQTFLLLLGAFLLGTSLACLIRRGLGGRTAAATVATSASLATAAAAEAAVSPGDADRFGRALTGGHEAGAFQPATGPVVEVQPRPPVRVTPLIETVDAAPAPAAAEPVPPPEPEVVSAPAPEPEPQPDVGESYTQIAVAVAAGAAAIAAAGGGIQAASEETAVEEDAADAASDDAPPPNGDGLSYTEIAVATAGGLAAAAAAGSEDEPEPEVASDGGTSDEVVSAEAVDAFEADETAESHFGTPVADVVPASADADVGDDLTRINSIDAGLRDRLNRLGVTRFADIGGWSASDVIRYSQSLGVVPGRIEQENWVGQAQVLAGAGVTDYSRWRGPELMPRAAPPADGERLHRIIGIDPDSEGILRANGVTTLADIAAWTDEDVSWFEGILGAQGRIGRENWVEQARFLTRGSGVASAIQTVAAPAAVTAAVAAAAAAAAAGGQETAPEPEPAEAEVEAEAAEPEASEPEPGPEAAEESDGPPPAALAGGRGEGYSGLRSVRSEALIGSGGGLVVPPAGEVDDLKRIRGIGVLIEKKLHSLGITSYEQVANWTGEDIERISHVLDFKGRIERENWIEQARILASGGQTEFSRRVDRGET